MRLAAEAEHCALEVLARLADKAVTFRSKLYGFVIDRSRVLLAPGYRPVTEVALNVNSPLADESLAAKTSAIKIGTVPLIMALRNPVLLAHTLATLDVISSGRIIIVVGAGHQYPYAAREFAACGVPYHERAGRLNESIQLIRRLWTESAFAYAGKYFQFEELGVEPKPIQRPLPIWIAAGDNENALRRVARLGDGWFTVAHTAEQFVARRQKIDHYTKEYDRVGPVTPSALFATFNLHTNGKTAREEGWNFAERYFRQPRSELGHDRSP